MQIARIAVAGWAVATLVVGVATAGCGNDTKAPSTGAGANGSGSTQPVDYAALLVKQHDIGGDFTASGPPVQNPNGAPGVSQLFSNADGSRVIGDAILIVADPATAAVGVANTKNNYASKVTGGDWQPADVGSNGTIISGSMPDNSHAITVLVFSEGKAMVSLEFDSAPNDPIDREVALDIGRKQDAALKEGLPKYK
jgi:hypothetical protein